MAQQQQVQQTQQLQSARSSLTTGSPDVQFNHRLACVVEPHRLPLANMSLLFKDMLVSVVEHALLPGPVLVSVVEHMVLPGPRRWCSTRTARLRTRGGYVNAGGAFELPR